jgi:hypothetical protein
MSSSAKARSARGRSKRPPLDRHGFVAWLEGRVSQAGPSGVLRGVDGVLARVRYREDRAYCLAYVEARLVGDCSPRGADMIASRRGPELLTDAVYLQGNHGDSQWAIDPITRQIGQATQAAARRHGHNGSGTYVPSLARFVGDPEAFVSGRGDIARVIRARHARGERGWTVDGAVKVPPVDRPVKRTPPKRPEKFSTVLRRNLAQAGVSLD